jgi:endonuclease YncB( thermonuclease family)
MNSARFFPALLLLLGGMVVLAGASGPAAQASQADRRGASLGSEAAVFESCTDADTCIFTEGRKLFIVTLAGVDAPKLAGRCAKEIVTARRARDELIVLLRSAQTLTLQMIGHVDADGRVMAHVFADGVDVGQILMNQGLAGSKANWMRKGWC